jgi:membrane protein DedA with SNARE-associated domain
MPSVDRPSDATGTLDVAPEPDVEPDEAAETDDEQAGDKPKPKDPFADVVVTRWDVACVGPIVLSSLYSLLGQPLTPALLGSHPLLAAFLRGSVPSMILCGALAHGGDIPLWQAIAAPFLILTWVDPFMYWAGRRYGRAILDYYAGQSDSMRRRVARGEAWFARYGVWAIVFSAYIPVSIIFFIAAGESRMRFSKFLAADAVANLLWISTIVTLGWFLGRDRGQTAADAISHYALYLTIASIVLVVVLVVRQTRANMRAMSDRQNR